MTAPALARQVFDLLGAPGTSANGILVPDVPRARAALVAIDNIIGTMPNAWNFQHQPGDAYSWIQRLEVVVREFYPQQMPQMVRMGQLQPHWCYYHNAYFGFVHGLRDITVGVAGGRP